MKVFLLVALLAAPLGALAQYKCVEEGKTTYSERPCSGEAVEMARQQFEQATMTDSQAVDTSVRDKQLERIDALQKTIREVEATYATPSGAERAAPAAEKSGALGVVFICILLFVYFMPAINAGLRRHPSKSAVMALNLFLGWTFLGWVAALVWSYKSAEGAAPAPTKKTHTRCPDCAELVLREANVCKHCGKQLRSV